MSPVTLSIPFDLSHVRPHELMILDKYCSSCRYLAQLCLPTLKKHALRTQKTTLGVQTPSLFCATSWGLSGNFRQFSGNFRQSAWALFGYFQAILAMVVFGDFGGAKAPRKSGFFYDTKRLRIARLN